MAQEVELLVSVECQALVSTATGASNIKHIRAVVRQDNMIYMCVSAMNLSPSCVRDFFYFLFFLYNGLSSVLKGG